MVRTRNRVTNWLPSGKVSSLKTNEYPIYEWCTQRGIRLKTRMPEAEVKSVEIGESIMVWSSGGSHLRLIEEFNERLVDKEIDVDKLQIATNATDEEVNEWLGFLLQDYNVEPTTESMDEAGSFIKLWLKEQVLKKGLKLKEAELSKLFKFTVRLAYEALYVGSG